MPLVCSCWDTSSLLKKPLAGLWAMRRGGSGQGWCPWARRFIFPDVVIMPGIQCFVLLLCGPSLLETAKSEQQDRYSSSDLHIARHSRLVPLSYGFHNSEDHGIRAKGPQRKQTSGYVQIGSAKFDADAQCRSRFGTGGLASRPPQPQRAMCT